MPIRPRNPVTSSGMPTNGQLSTASATPTAAGDVEVRARTRHRVGPAEVQSPPVRPKRAHHKIDRTGSNWDEDGDYIVGRGRPPKAHQWQKGQSGNPRGPKPKEQLSPEAAFQNAVLSSSPAKVNGADVSLSLGEFGLNVLKGAAAKGNRQAATYLVELYLQTLRKTSDIEVGDELMAEEQAAVNAILDELGLPDAPVRRQIDRNIDADGEAR